MGRIVGDTVDGPVGRMVGAAVGARVGRIVKNVITPHSVGYIVGMCDGLDVG